MTRACNNKLSQPAHLALWFTTTIIIALFALPAQAELTVCNETDVLRSVAIGYKAKEEWVSEGWWNVETGACKTLLSGDLQNQYYYVRATSPDAPFEGEDFWFCTEKDPFTIIGDKSCDDRGYKRVEFSQIDTGTTSPNFRLTLAGSKPDLIGPDGKINNPSPDVSKIWEKETYEIAEIPASLVTIGNDKLECDLENAVASFGAQSFGLADGRVFHLVTCNTGDVNIEYFAAMENPATEKFKLYTFESPPAQNMPERETIITPSFDAKTMALSSTLYNSPDADCGTHALYQYNADADKFDLVEIREKPICDGQGGGESDYPLTWSRANAGQ